MEEFEYPSAKRRKLYETKNERGLSFANLPLELFLQIADNVSQGDPIALTNFCSTDKRTREICLSRYSMIPLTSLFSVRMNLLDYARYLAGDLDPVRDWLWAWWNRSHNTLLSSGIGDPTNEAIYADWLERTEWSGQPLEEYYDLDPRTVRRNDLLLFVMSPPTDAQIPDDMILFDSLVKKGFQKVDGPIPYIASNDTDAFNTNSSVIGIPLGSDIQDREGYVRVVDLPFRKIARLLYLPINVRYADTPSLIARLHAMTDQEREEFGNKVKTLYLSSLYEQLPADAVSNFEAPTIFDMFNIALALGYDENEGETLYLFAKFENDTSAIHPQQPNYWT